MGILVSIFFLNKGVPECIDLNIKSNNLGLFLNKRRPINMWLDPSISNL